MQNIRNIILALCIGFSLIMIVGALTTTYNPFTGKLDYTGHWFQNGTDIYYNFGNLGINTTNPLALLHINGTPGSQSYDQGILFGDGNSGIYERAEDSLGIVLNGSETYTFGIFTFKVGAGANKPAMYPGRVASGVSVTIAPSDSDSNTGLGTAGDDTLSLIAGGVNGLNINETGGVAKVGIGTTSPDAKVDVRNGGNAYVQIDPDGVNAQIKLNKDATNKKAEIIFYTNGVNDFFMGTSDSDVAGAGTEFFIGEEVGGANARFWIEPNSGNIGFNNTNPQSLVHVGGGNIRIDNNQAYIIEDKDGTGTVVLSMTTANNVQLRTPETGSLQFTTPAGEFHFITAGTRKMTLLNNGNFGVNETNPQELIDVNGAVEFGDLNMTVPVMAIKGGAGGSQMVTLERTSGATIKFGWSLAGGTLAFKDITNNQFVMSLFQVGGKPEIIMGLKGQSTGTTPGKDGTISAEPADEDAADIIGGDFYFASGKGRGAATLSDIHFQTPDIQASGKTEQTVSTKMLIQGDGNVGIGTVSPEAPLHVSIGSVGGTPDSSVTMILERVGNSDLQFFGRNTDSQRINFGDPEDRDDGRISYSHSTSTMFFRAGNAERMVIEGNGEVGIGILTPTEVLQVAGNIFLQNDSDKLYFGQLKDVSISFDGTSTNFTNEVGSGDFIFPTGEVGIGGIPIYDLDVRGTDSEAQLHFAKDDVDSGGYLTSANPGNFYMSGGAVWTGSEWLAKHTSANVLGGVDDIFQWYLNTGLTPGVAYSLTEEMRLTNVGLGIGGIIPVVPLDLYTTGTTKMMWHNTASGLGTTNGVYAGLFDNGDWGIWNYENDIFLGATNDIEFWTAGDIVGRIYASGGLSWGDTYEATDPGVDNMIIEGDVGIGTTLPTHKLNVVGSANITGNMTTNQYYGSMAFHNDTDGNVTALTEDVWSNFIGFDQPGSNEQLLNGVDYSRSNLTIVSAGVYDISYGASFSGTVNNKYHTTIGINGVENIFCESHDRISTGSDILSTGFPCQQRLSVGDQITLMYLNEDSGGDSTTLSARVNIVRTGN